MTEDERKKAIEAINKGIDYFHDTAVQKDSPLSLHELQTIIEALTQPTAERVDVDGLRHNIENALSFAEDCDRHLQQYNRMSLDIELAKCNSVETVGHLEEAKQRLEALQSPPAGDVEAIMTDIANEVWVDTLDKSQIKAILKKHLHAQGLFATAKR